MWWNLQKITKLQRFSGKKPLIIDNFVFIKK
jgi:hypothetical protein